MFFEGIVPVFFLRALFFFFLGGGEGEILMLSWVLFLGFVVCLGDFFAFSVLAYLSRISPKVVCLLGDVCCPFLDK